MNLPANWRTAISGIGAVVFSALTVLAALPYTLGDIATIIPADWKPYVVTCGLIGTIGLRVWNSIAQKSKEVVGGSVQQTMSGAIAKPGTQTLVDQTLVATKASGESVTPEQQTTLNNLPQ